MNEFSNLIEAFIRKKQEDKGLDFCIASWLDSAAKRVSQISVATHVLKYTHGDAKGSNIFNPSQNINNIRIQYVSTDSLIKVREDLAVRNAAAMDIAGLLYLEISGVTFLDLIIKDDFSPLARFTDNPAQLSSWIKGFKSVLSDPQLSTHTLAKQIYFPNKDDKYHLLAPLYSSSLSQAIYDRIIENRFSEKAKIARDCKKRGEYSNTIVIDYPDLAIQTFGGTKPQNISRLNTFRKGRSFLLRSVPPVWKTIKKPPMRKNEFWNNYGRRASMILKEFKRFLNAVRTVESNKDIRDQRYNFVDQLIDLLFQVAAEVQAMNPGWSIASNIPFFEQVWLDPLREDLTETRYQDDWKEAISNYFATWTIRKLKDKNLHYEDVEYTYFKDAFLKALKEIE